MITFLLAIQCVMTASHAAYSSHVYQKQYNITHTQTSGQQRAVYVPSAADLRLRFSALSPEAPVTGRAPAPGGL